MDDKQRACKADTRLATCKHTFNVKSSVQPALATTATVAATTPSTTMMRNGK